VVDKPVVDKVKDLVAAADDVSAVRVKEEAAAALNQTAAEQEPTTAGPPLHLKNSTTTFLEPVFKLLQAGQTTGLFDLFASLHS
jgi:hypothetical protein